MYAVVLHDIIMEKRPRMISVCDVIYYRKKYICLRVNNLSDDNISMG